MHGPTFVMPASDPLRDPLREGTPDATALARLRALHHLTVGTVPWFGYTVRYLPLPSALAFTTPGIPTDLPHYHEEAYNLLSDVQMVLTAHDRMAAELGASRAWRRRLVAELRAAWAASAALQRQVQGWRALARLLLKGTPYAAYAAAGPDPRDDEDAGGFAAGRPDLGDADGDRPGA